LLAGQFTTVNGSSRSGIARVNSDGNLDSGFNPGTGTNSTVFATALQTDGKVLLGGTFSTVKRGELANVARLSSDGSVDGGIQLGQRRQYRWQRHKNSVANRWQDPDL